MQIQHETQLIEGLATLKAEDFAPKSNQTLESYTLTQAALNAIDYLVSCPVGNNIAAYIANTNQIVIIDTKTHSKRERFPLKSCDRKFSKQSFTLKGIDYSPDGTRLAIGQTDCIIYVYKLSSTSPTDSSSLVEQPNLKPIITGKFVCSSPVTCLIWTDIGIVFGTQDGKVKLISTPVKSTTSDVQSSSSTTSAKVSSVYGPSKAGAVPISLAYKSPVIAIGFLDYSVLLLAFSAIDNTDLVDQSSAIGARRNSSQQPPIIFSFVHTCPPYYLTILHNTLICCAGSDGKVAFYTTHYDSSHCRLDHSNSNNNEATGQVTQQIIELKEDLVALDYSGVNEVLAVETSTKLLFIKHDQESRAWQLQGSHIELTNALSLTSCVWARDGSQLIVGTLTGSLELFRCTWSKQSVGEQLDICHIAKNRVRVTDRARNLLATYKTQYNIKKVNLLDNGQSVIIWTTNSLLLARLSGYWQQSEIAWGRADRSVKFCFDHPGFVFVYNSANHLLMLVKLGQDSIIYSVKMDSIRKATLGARQYPSPSGYLIAGSNDRQQRSSPSSATRSRHSSITGSHVPPPPASSDGDSSLPPQPTDSHQQQQQQQVSDSPQSDVSLNERLALVMDSDQLVVINLKTNTREQSRRHEAPVIWLELSHTSNSLVFRDTANKLYLLALDKGGKCEQLLDNCEFAKWLPDSDILIGQSLHNISIWYNIDDLNKITLLDSRSYNINQAPPIIDLSFADRKSKPYPTIVKIGTNYKVHLSNGQTVPMDRVKVKFYTELVGGRLNSAFDVLEREQTTVTSKGAASGSQNLDLWSRLGWLAVERADLQVAIRVFTRLGHTNMVKYLETCVAKPDEREWRLALIRGDWATFERVAEPQQIVSTYKRLNRWTLLIDYLNKAQQFRQRDLVELEYRQWLLDRGRYLEGAKIQAANGDLLGAVELLMNNKRFHEAAELFLTKQKVSLAARARDRSTQMDLSLLDVARKLKSSLLEIGEYKLAAQLCDKLLDEQYEALDLYIQGGSYEKAIELAKSTAADRVAQIEESYGDHLMAQYRSSKISRRVTLAAIERYLTSGKHVKALEAALELKDFVRGYEILPMLKSKDADGGNGDDTVETDRRRCVEASSKPIAEYMLRNGETQKAIEALMIGQHFNETIDLLIEQGEYKRAYEISLGHVNGGDRVKTSSKFMTLAERLVEAGKPNEAERVYLMLDLPDLAIEMHRRLRSYDRMLELVAEHSADSLEATLLRLARELESEGQYELAEQYLLRASPSEWTNVVRMYRLAGKWEHAYRVALVNCGSERDPLLVQLAYWWAKSYGPANMEEAHKLLRRLNVVNSIIEFCCENRNYPFALELSACHPAADVKRTRDVACRYAAHLEEQHKFERAEEVLLRFNLVEEAARMYLDNDQHLDAIRVVESQLGRASAGQAAGADNAQLVALLNRTLVECANRLVGGLTITQQLISGHLGADTSERLLAAQQMYLRAQRPELAVNLYKERGMWKEAIQVAQRFAPQLLESVELALDSEVAQDVGPIVAQLDASRRDTMQRQRSRQDLATSGEQRRSVQGSPNVNSTGSGGGSDYLRSQAESSMRNGDLGGTKTALGKFLSSLIEGGGD